MASSLRRTLVLKVSVGAECESNWNIPQHWETLYLQIIWRQLLAPKYKFGWNND
jgi:hypothetical protein